jgi:hypothetical protein
MSQLITEFTDFIVRHSAGLRAGRSGFSGSISGEGWEFFSSASRTALEPTEPPVQWVPGALFLGVRRPGREADHSPPSSAEVKEWVELYLHSPDMPSWYGAQLKHRDNFTFTFYWLNCVLASKSVTGSFMLYSQAMFLILLCLSMFLCNILYEIRQRNSSPCCLTTTSCTIL